MNEFMEQAELPSRVAVIDVHVNERRVRVRQSDTSDFIQRDLPSRHTQTPSSSTRSTQ